MIVFCPAKINLGLRILNKRPDGYHNIESVFHHIPLYDVLEFVEANTFSFQSSGLKIPGKHDDNLIIKAYNLLKNDHDIPPLHIHLIKKIPMGGGLGGGSSNVAHFIRGVNEVFKLKIKVKDMESYAAEIGSDCPFFIHDHPQLVTGRGENLQPIDVNLENHQLCVVFPDLHISTPEAYSGVIPSEDGNTVRDIIQQPIDQWKGHLINDFEKSIFKKHPELNSIKNELYNAGAIYASMSGSGATLFGIFPPDKNVKALNWKYSTKFLELI